MALLIDSPRMKLGFFGASHPRWARCCNRRWPQSEQRSKHRREWWTRTGIPSAKGEVAATTKDFANNTADAIHTVGDAATAPIKAAWRATPFSSLTSSQERQPAFNDSINR